jgi:hypothetical protein
MKTDYYIEKLLVVKKGDGKYYPRITTNYDKLPHWPFSLDYPDGFDELESVIKLLTDMRTTLKGSGLYRPYEDKKEEIEKEEIVFEL